MNGFVMFLYWMGFIMILFPAENAQWAGAIIVCIAYALTIPNNEHPVDF